MTPKKRKKSTLLNGASPQVGRPRKITDPMATVATPSSGIVKKKKQATLMDMARKGAGGLLYYARLTSLLGYVGIVLSVFAKLCVLNNVY